MTLSQRRMGNAALTGVAQRVYQSSAIKVLAAEAVAARCNSAQPRNAGR